MIRLQREHITRPDLVLPLVYLVFLVLAIIALRIELISRHILAPVGAFQPPGLKAYAITFLGIAILGGSAKFGGRIQGRLNSLWLMPFITILALLALNLGTVLPAPLILAIALGFPILLLFVSKQMSDVNTLGKIAYALAILFSFTILVRGIPILSAAGRANIAVDPSRALFHGFGVFAAALLTAGQKRKWAASGVISLVFIGLLSGFKSDAVAVLMAAVLTGLLLNKISVKEVLGAGAIILLILTGVSTFIAFISYDQWSIPPVLYIVYRAGFTFSAFGLVVDSAFPWGYLKGAALLDPSQRILSTTLLPQYYPEPHIITSTFLGPGMLDFGLIGVVLTALFVGLYLGYMHSLKKDVMGAALYAIALTHSFILVEVGLQMTSILLYMSLLYLMLARPET